MGTSPASAGWSGGRCPCWPSGMLGLVYLSLGRHVLRERRALASLPAAAANGPNAPNVLLVVLDTVRADRLSLYGYGRDTTPNLARLARRGVRFDQATFDGPLDAPLARQHDDRPLAPPALGPPPRAARRHVPDPRRVPRRPRLRHRRVRRQHHLLQRRDRPRPRLRPLRGPRPLAPGIFRTSALGRRLVWPWLVVASELARGRPPSPSPSRTRRGSAATCSPGPSGKAAHAPSSPS